MAGRDRRPTPSQHRPLSRAARLVGRRPRLVLAVWFAVLGILAIQGSGLADKVSIGAVFVDGSEAQRTDAVVREEFGSDSVIVVVMRGPERDLNRQGRALVARLNRLPNTLVNSPWDAGQTIDGLEPGPEVASFVVGVGRRPGVDTKDSVLGVEEEVHRAVSEPVRASVTGGLLVAYALRNALDHGSTSGERLAIPVLLILLLFVCRSLIAAAMPVVIGAVVVAATKGVLVLCAGLVKIDPFALGATGMLGLALGVDYSLLVVSRFREERKSGGDPVTAVERTVLATGRSVIPAGCGLILAMLVAAQFLPSALISSVALAVTTAAVLSMLSAIFATPAVLLLVGKHLDRWSLPPRKDEPGLILRWSRRVSSRPGIVLAVVFVLFLCAGWAFTLQTDIDGVAELPPDDPVRVQSEDVREALGAGWFLPYEVVMKSDDGPVTTPARLQALTTFQRRVEADPGIATMTGFGGVKRGGEQLQKLGPGLRAQERGIAKIDAGLGKVAGGAAASTDGLFAAQDGAQQLDSALGQTVTGSGRLADGLEATTKGSERLGGGLVRADEGSGKLAEGAEKSSDGAAKMARALKHAQERAGESTSSSRVLENALASGERSLAGLDETVRGSEQQLGAARQALQRMTVGRDDPQYAAALAAVEEASKGLGGGTDGEEEVESVGVPADIEHAQSQFDLGQYLTAQIAENGRDSQEGIAKLAKASRRLDRGLRRLASSSEDVSDGIAKLSEGGQELSPGLRKLTDSAERLVGGLTEIGSGAGELAGGLGKGAQGSSRLSVALGRLHSGSGRLRGPAGEGPISRLDERSPGLFKSGYFLLASMDGSKAEPRRQVNSLINLDDGGSAARMLVIPRYRPATSEGEETETRLHGHADQLQREAQAEVLVGGGTPATTDLIDDLREQAPITRLVLSLVTILILLMVTRSLVLPLIAALLNLLTVSATFGVVSLLFNGSLLGGPGYVDTVAIPTTIILVFGLAIDYEVFIFARMREEYVRTGSASQAITEGLGRSANVVTGAAVIMISVFLAFAVSPLATLRSFGVTLAIAVFIDAFLIRFVIIPATMRALGARSWWIPRWLDRLLPGGGSPVLVGEGER
jgi:RND superfamily putative drug exporter